ncbi:MAG: alpha/beta fold hydrolase [Pseudomonadales bacterium]
MDRRDFLRITGLGWIASVLPGCGNDGEDPAAHFPPPSEWMDLATLRRTFTRVNGLRMHALISIEPVPADAPAVVLVHGSGLSGQYMIPTARALTPDFRVYVPDIPGYGDSGDPGKILDVPEMADWLAAWMPTVGLARASFLGNSFGCQVIVDLAARYPGLVEAALLQGPTTPPGERSGFWQFVRWRQNQPYNPGWLGDVTQRDYEKAGALRLLRSFIFQITDRIEDKAPLVQAPTLVMRGDLDPIAHQAFCDLLVELLPRGQLYVIPGEAHTLVFTAPEPLAAGTREFLGQLRLWHDDSTA